MSDLRPEIPPALDQLIVQMMSKESSARPESCHEAKSRVTEIYQQLTT
ncbi:MAG: hypothetical protein AAFS10_12790 [Myxococcota bacterium]